MYIRENQVFFYWLYYRFYYTGKSILLSDHELGHALFGQTETKTILRPREAIDSLDDSIFLESPPKKEHVKTASNVTLKR